MYFFDSWTPLARTLVIGLICYGGLVLLLRLSGKRTLSKWNAFDLVVTVALGSSLATSLLSKDVTAAQGLLAFALLIGLQFGVTWLTVRLPGLGRLFKSQPTLLLYRGELCREALRRERVPEREVLAALRAGGIGELESVAAVVLETDGTFSVIRELGQRETALADVEGHPAAGSERRPG